MIIDNLKNAGLYYGVSSGLKLALEYLQQTDFSKMGPGRYEIDGTNVFALVQKYETKPKEQGVWEAHRKYIDVQFIYSGVELMGYSCIEGMEAAREYDEAGDCLLLNGGGSFFRAASGTFVVFAPGDAHMPCITDKVPSDIKKIVVKVRVIG